VCSSDLRGFGGCFGSWSLTVAFANEALPPRNLNVWHGWQLTTPSINGGEQSFTVGGITPPPNGAVNARIGVVQADGDRGLGPDSLDISSPTNPQWRPFTSIDRPLAAGEHDWFNSTVTVFGERRRDDEATPNLLANLNQDIALVSDASVIGNDDSSFSFRISLQMEEVETAVIVNISVARVFLNRRVTGFQRRIQIILGRRAFAAFFDGPWLAFNAIRGSDAFLDPLIRRVPESRLPPSITNASTSSSVFLAVSYRSVGPIISPDAARSERSIAVLFTHRHNPTTRPPFP